VWLWYIISTQEITFLKKREQKWGPVIFSVLIFNRIYIMITTISNDVENYILNIVINGNNIQIISQVCKNWKKITMISNYKKQENNLYNMTRMLIEDKELKKNNLDLAKKCEKFYSRIF
jgi:hypothetical protein